MYRVLVLLAILTSGSGCERMIMRTQNRVAMDGTVDTRLTDFCPVSPVAGPVKPVVVDRGAVACEWRSSMSMV